MEGLAYTMKVDASNPDYTVNIYENDLGKLYQVMTQKNNNKQLGKIIETSTNR